MEDTTLWLDDQRDPKIWSKTIKDSVWVKTFNEFKDFIENHPMPSIISFDHDLADEHIEDFLDQKEKDPIAPVHPNYESYTEKTGYDAAKWLVNYCKENCKKLPLCWIHSANIVGGMNIKIYLDNAKKHLDL